MGGHSTSDTRITAMTDERLAEIERQYKREPIPAEWVSLLLDEVRRLRARAEKAEWERDEAIENMRDNFASWEEEWKQEKEKVAACDAAADRWLASIAEVNSRGTGGLQNWAAEIGGMCAKEIKEAIA